MWRANHIVRTGISRAYGGALSALSIHYSLTPVSGSGKDQIWKEIEVVSALYTDRTEVLAVDERAVVGEFETEWIERELL